MSAVASQTPGSRLFTEAFIQAQMNENVNAPRHWPFLYDSTSDRWIHLTKGQ